MRISDWSSYVCASDLTVHALMNFGSLIHNMPAISKGMQRLKGETDEQWMQRIGHVGSVFGTGKNQTAVPNAGEILYGAFKDSWKTSHDQFTKLAFERGYMNQEVAELERPFPAIKTPGEIGRAHVCTPDTNAHLVCRAL